MDSGQPPDSDVIENLVFRFEVAWQEGEQPQIDDFLPQDAAGRREVLIELAHVDLEFRLKADEEARAEQYFNRFPELNREHEIALNLIVAEYQFRSRREPRPSIEEYRNRFPGLWDQLLQRLTANNGVNDETLLSSLSDAMPQDDCTVVPDSSVSGTTNSDVGPTEFRYKIIDNHASGGLGDVFIAHDQEVPREVALKQLKGEYAHDLDSQVRFLREAEITGGLEHPGIVPVYGMGAYADGRPYYAMRFVRGGSLKEAITRYHETLGHDELSGLRSLKLRKLLTRFIEVCHAIDYAHSRGVLHRDIKPANIMLGKYGETLVVDWGLAKPIGRTTTEQSTTDEVTLRPQSGSGSSATQLGSAVGTPSYMSPEQASGQVDSLDATTDIFSLGATLYHLLTGQPAQTSPQVSVVLGRVARGEFLPPRAVQPDIPPALEAICLKAMALDRGERYQSAGALAADIENWLADEPVNAYRESLWDRSRRWMRRHRTIVSSAAVAGVLLTIAAVITFIARDHARQEDRVRLSRLEATVNAAEQSALAELRADRYTSALGFIDSAIEQLNSQPLLGELRLRLTRRRAHIQRLARFHRLSAQAEELAIFENNEEAISACWSALEALSVFDHNDWWAHLPDDDLSPQQADRLRQRVYDQLILLSMFKAKSTILNFMSPTVADESREMFKLAELVQRFRHAESIACFENYANFRLGKIQTPESILAPHRPQTAADNNAVGLMAWSMALNPVMRNAILAGRGIDQNLTELAQMYLERSAALNPDRFMTIISLGFINLAAEGFLTRHGKLTINVLSYAPTIVLDTDCVQRISGRSPTKQTTQQQANMLLQAALLDAEKAHDLAPTTYYVHWYRGEVFREMGQMSEAVASFMNAIHLGKMTVDDERGS